MENIRLTNGNETFLLGFVIEDERGPVHANDSRGSGYTRCDLGASCDHDGERVWADGSVTERQVWHDDEHTEMLWRVA